MSMSTRQPALRPRRHGLHLGPADRRALERAGWRTTLDYRENHVRARDGRLLEVIPAWTAEAERFDGYLSFVTAVGPTADAAWAQLRADVEARRIRTVQAVAAVRLVSSWPEMGSRYDAPADAATAAREQGPATEQELWKALDEGRDPTDPERDDGRPDPAP